MTLHVTGTTLVARRAGGLALVDLAGAAAPIELAIDDVHAAAPVGDELWIVAGAPAQVQRYRLRDGAAVGEPLALGDGPGRLVAGGAGHATWLGTPARQLRVERGALTQRALGDGLDFALPVGPVRTLVARRGAIALRDGDLERWTAAPGAGARVEAGALVFDGRSAALAIAHARGHAVLVLGLADGVVQQRFELERASLVRLAPRRNAAVAVLEDRRAVMIDLRFGEVLASHAFDEAIEDLALDERAQVLVMKLAGRSELEVSMTSLARGSAPRLAPEGPREPAIVAAPEPEPEPAAACELVDAPEPACDPEPVPIARASLAETRALLDAHGELVATSVAVAVARAWDRGRLAYPDAASHPFHSVVAGTLGSQRGLAPAELAATRAAVARAEASLGELRARLEGRASAFDALADELGLSEAAREIVWVIAAPLVWGELARVYGVLANDDHRALCDEQLVTEILGERFSRHAIHDELDPRAPLVRHGLVEVGAGAARPFLALSVPGVVLAHLRGGDPLAELPAAIEPLPARGPGALAALHLPPALARTARREVTAARAPLRLAVRGRVASGRRSLVAALVERAAVISLGRLPGAREDALRRALCQARLAGLVPCVDGLEHVSADDPVAWDGIRRVLDEHPGPVCVRLDRGAPVPLAPGHVLVELPAQTAAERLATWRAALAEAGATLDGARLDELAGRFAIGPGAIVRACREVASPAALPAPELAARVDRAVRQHLADRLGTIATRVERLATWAQIVLPPDVQTGVSELIGRIRHRHTVFDTWGFDRVIATSRGVVALFQGGPGTGKTLVAGAIAHELGVPLYKVDVSRVVSKWVGETEQNLARLFDAAEDGNAIVLFDEADALFAKRTEVKSSNDRYANLGVNFLLERLDRFEGIAILTTNLAGAIDGAFARRLAARLTFPFPEEDERERLWRMHLPAQAPTHGDLDLAGLARRYRMSGGYIRNCALRAAFLAAEQGVALSAGHLVQAIRAEYRSLGKLGDTGELG